MSDSETGEEGYTRRIGWGMVVFAWVAVLGLLTVLFQPLLEQQVNPNREIVGQVDAQGAREVVLQRNRAGHYIATGLINQQPVVFLLDTGATDVAISSALADRLNVDRGRAVNVRTANGMTRAYRATLDQVSLGNITMNNVSASIMSGMGTTEVLLGMSFLKRLELTQKGSTLTLRQK